MKALHAHMNTTTYVVHSVAAAPLVYIKTQTSFVESNNRKLYERATQRNARTQSNMIPKQRVYSTTRLKNICKKLSVTQRCCSFCRVRSRCFVVAVAVADADDENDSDDDRNVPGAFELFTLIGCSCTFPLP